MNQLDPIAQATIYDGALTWKIKSRSDPHVEYVVELGDYVGNGRCDCDDFRFKFEPHLCRGINAEQAVAQKLVKWPDPRRRYQLEVTDALRCAHIAQARGNAITAVIATITRLRREHAATYRH